MNGEWHGTGRRKPLTGLEHMVSAEWYEKYPE